MNPAMFEPENPITVMLAHCRGYDPALVGRHAGELLDGIGFKPSNASRILVKPNFLKAETTGCVCTNAAVISACCAYLRDHGCRVVIGDSPGFGTAAGVARSIGLPGALARAGCADVPVISLDAPLARPLSCGGTVGISRHALEADAILDLPKLKAHSQMRVTLAVKNLFGCVSGVRKALLHTLHGDKEKDGAQVFPSVVLDIMNLLPPAVALIDGVIAMHVTGPGNGRPFPANLLAASTSPLALDTAVYMMLGVTPEAVPVWAEARRRRLPGAFPEDVAMAGAAASSFDFASFVLPPTLLPQTFNPVRLAVSACRRLWAKVRA